MEGVSSELGPLEYLSGLLDKPMDQIINWFILIIIFVFDPLAVALVIAFNNALQVDRGIVDKKKVIRKRELYDEELKRISTNIGTLSNARSQQIQVRDTSVVGGVRTTISTSELRLAQKRIEVEEQNRKSVQAKREVASDSLQSIQLKILDLE